MGTNALRRRILSAFMRGLCIGAAGVAMLALGLVLYFLLAHGAGALHLSLFTRLPDAVDTSSGGMKQSMLGTAILLGLASLIGLPIGILTGIYQAEGRGRLAAAVRFVTDVLNAVPSIVIGIFVYAIWVYPQARLHPGQGYSAYAGGFALGILMIPTVTRTTEEMLRLVPFSLHEASLGLGASRWRTMWSVVLPAARSGIVTGVMLALARISGETAPLLFTILGNEFLQTHRAHIGGAAITVPTLNAPIDALPLRVFNYATSVDPNQQGQAWAGALVLIGMVFIVSLAARVLTREPLYSGQK